jgi:hypothetical protein
LRLDHGVKDKQQVSINKATLESGRMEQEKEPVESEAKAKAEQTRKQF